MIRFQFEAPEGTCISHLSDCTDQELIIKVQNQCNTNKAVIVSNFVLHYQNKLSPEYVAHLYLTKPENWTVYNLRSNNYAS